MSSGLTAALSEFTKRSELSNNPLTADPPSERPLHSSSRNLSTSARSWLKKLVPLARFLVIFFGGVAATLAWQSYSGAAREAIASLSPRLGWLAPAAAPAAASPERLKATTLALAAVRQSVDKLSSEISRLQTPATADRTSAPPPSRPGSRRL